MQINIKKNIPLIYGLNSNGMNCYTGQIKILKSVLKRTKKNEYTERNFSNPKQSRLFLSKLQKRVFKRFRKPIFSKIEDNGKKIIYKIGVKIWVQ